MSENHAAEPACVGASQARPDHDQNYAAQAPFEPNGYPDLDEATNFTRPKDMADVEDKPESVKDTRTTWKSTLTAKWRTFTPYIQTAWAYCIEFLKWLTLLLSTILLMHLVFVGITRMPGYSQTEKGTADSVQDMIDFKRGELLESRLPKRLFEEHPQCLARAITIAHDQYNGLPYQSVQEIVDDTVWWANDECSRLVFTPDIPLTRWNWFFRAITDKAESTFHRCTTVFSRFFGVKKLSDPKKAGSEALVLPAGYQILCKGKDRAVCKLSSTVTPSVRMISELVGQIDASSAQRSQWYPSKITSLTLEAISWLNIGCLVGWFVVWIVKFGNAVRQRDLFGNRTVYRDTLILMLVRGCSIALHTWYLKITEADYNLEQINLTTVIIHNIVIISSWVSLVILWEARSIIFFGSSDKNIGETALEQKEVSITGHGKHWNATTMANEHAPDEEGIDRFDEASETVPDATTSRPLRIDPNTSFHEDVQQMREHLHEKQAAVESGPGSPPLTESTANDIYDEGKVTNTGNESEWTMVPGSGSSMTSLNTMGVDHERQATNPPAGDEDGWEYRVRTTEEPVNPAGHTYPMSYVFTREKKKEILGCHDDKCELDLAQIGCAMAEESEGGRCDRECNLVLSAM